MGKAWSTVGSIAAVVALAACGVADAPHEGGAAPALEPLGAADALAVVEALQARFGVAVAPPAEDEPAAEPSALWSPALGPAEAVSFKRRDGRLTPRFASSASSVAALPERASDAFALRDEASGLSVEVALTGAVAVPAEPAGGYLLYRGAHPGGGDVVHRPTPEGTEDFVVFEEAPAEPVVRYTLELGERVAGLRLVGQTLELLDAGGAPRLRVAPPSIVDRDGTRHPATLAVEGCAADDHPAAPWGRPITAAGARRCGLRVAWSGAPVAYPALLDPAWTTTSSLGVSRSLHAATRLESGQVLVVGGIDGTRRNSAELYDPATGTWAATGSLAFARHSHTATTLGDGRVLVAGGDLSSGITSSTELYDPAAGTWSTMPAMSVGRSRHTASLLFDGRVLVAGGSTSSTVTQIFDPSSETWITTGSLATRRFSHAATVQNDGRVLVSGGFATGLTPPAQATSERYDPVTGVWSTGPTLATARYQHTLSTLPDGRVLALGGYTGTAVLREARLHNPVVGGWAVLADIPYVVRLHTATALRDGRVLVAGGTTSTATINPAPTAAVAIFDPSVAVWSAGPDPANARLDHTATLLPNGEVLAVGGKNNGSSVERFDPAPNGEGCYTGSNCTSGHCVRGVCCDTACGGGDPDDCMACSLFEGAAIHGTCGPAHAVDCDDGDACTQGDTCVEGVCASASVVVCGAADACHYRGTCDSETGLCDDPVKPDGAPCGDGVCLHGTCRTASVGDEGGAGGAGGSGGAGGTGGPPGAGGGLGGESGDGGEAGGDPTPQAPPPVDDGGCHFTPAPSAGGSAGWLVALGLVTAARRRRARRNGLPRTTCS